MRYIVTALSLFLILNHSWAGTYTDDFEDGDMDEWELRSIGAKGTWKIENEELVLQGAGGSTAIGFSIGENNWRDYTVQVSMKLTKHVVTNWWEQAGVGLRMFKGDNGLIKSGYYIALGTPGQNIKQLRTYYSDFVQVNNKHIQAIPFDWELSTWYVLKAVVLGNTFKYYVDDELVMEYTDANGPNGGVGLSVTASTEAHFDNFSVTGDDVPDNFRPVTARDRLVTVWGEIKKSIDTD